MYRSIMYALPVIFSGIMFTAAQSPDRHPVFEPLPEQAEMDSGNLFLNANVTVSGTYNGNLPEYAVDGNASPQKYWGSENIPVWFQIDMGKAQSLSSIHIWPYWQDGRVYQYKIEGSPDGKSWQMLIDQTGNSITGTSEGTLHQFNPLQVQHVRVTFTGNSKGAKAGGHLVEIKGYAETSGSKLTASAVSTYRRVSPTGAIPEQTMENSISSVAWRGERINGQIALHTTSSVKQVTLKTEALTSPEGGTIPIKASFVRFTKGKEQIYADIIDPVERMDMTAGINRSVWVSADIPASAKPGVYKGYVLIQGEGVDEEKIPVSLQVLPLALPPPSQWSCHVDIWQHPHAVARWHDVEPWSAEHFAIMKPLMKRLADLGQKTITCSLIHEAWGEQTYDWWPAMIEWIKLPNGKMTYDYTHFDQWVSFMLHDVGIDGTLTCYTMIPWSMKLRYYDQEKNTYAFVDLKPGDPSYEAIWGHFLTDFRKHVNEKGWLDKTCIGIDERPGKMVEIALGIVKKYAPEFKIVSAIDRPTDSTKGIYDFSVTFKQAGLLTPELVEERRKEGFKSTFYVCTNPKKPNTFTHSPLSECEWLGYFGAANRLDGILRWAYNSWNRNPFETTDFGNWPAGDCFLVYPGNRSSLRLEKFRDGIEEFEKISILRQHASSSKSTSEFKQAVTEMDQTLSELFTIKKGEGTEHEADVLKARELINKASILINNAK